MNQAFFLDIIRHIEQRSVSRCPGSGKVFSTGPDKRIRAARTDDLGLRQRSPKNALTTVFRLSK